ncbi:MAG: sugar-binding transcriptional regulator, partial [Rhizobiales bacterium]|nr:sugar-binding transcriptional regulator [Hyphomicrobiales bacterium]
MDAYWRQYKLVELVENIKNNIVQTNFDVNHDLAARAAWLSYIGGLSQTQIAERLGVSKVKIHRLINLAQKLGIIKAYVENVPHACINLENILIDKFGIKSCLIVPDLVEDCDDSDRHYPAIGAAGARFLQTYLENKSTKSIGVGKGRTLTSAVKQLIKIDRPDVKIYSIAGSLYRSLAANPYDVVLPLSRHLGGLGYFLPVPYIATNLEEKRQFQSQKFVQELLTMAQDADLFVIGLGALGEGSHVVSTGMMSEEERLEVCAKGAVSDLLGSFLDINGSLVDAPVNELKVGLHYEDLKGKQVLAMAGGADKAKAILAALRANVITDLISDEAAANAIVKLLN